MDDPAEASQGQLVQQPLSYVEYVVWFMERIAGRVEYRGCSNVIWWMQKIYPHRNEIWSK